MIGLLQFFQYPLFVCKARHPLFYPQTEYSQYLAPRLEGDQT